MTSAALRANSTRGTIFIVWHDFEDDFNPLVVINKRITANESINLNV